jgi:hypothetical protein
MVGELDDTAEMHLVPYMPLSDLIGLLKEALSLHPLALKETYDLFPPEPVP